VRRFKGEVAETAVVILLVAARGLAAAWDLAVATGLVAVLMVLDVTTSTAGDATTHSSVGTETDPVVLMEFSQEEARHSGAAGVLVVAGKHSESLYLCLRAVSLRNPASKGQTGTCNNTNIPSSKPSKVT